MKERVLKYLKQNKTELFGVFFIFVVAFILRFTGLLNNDFLWIDEAYSYSISYPHDLKTLFVKFHLLDSNMPLFYIFLHFWIKLFGKGLTTMGLLPLFFGVFQIPLIFYFAKEFFNKKVAFISATLLAISVFHIYYSFELRLYSLLSFFSILSMYFFIKILNDFSLKNKICFLTFSTFAFYTSNLTCLFLFAQFLVAIFYILKFKKENLKDFIKVYLIMFLLCVLGIFYLLYKLKISHSGLSMGDMLPFKPIYFITLLSEFFGANLNLFIGPSMTAPSKLLPFSIVNLLSYYLPILAGLVFVIVGFFKKDKNFSILMAVSLITVFLIVSFGYFKIIPYWSRYTFLIYPFVIVCLSFGISQSLKNKFLIFLLSIWLFFNSFYTFNNPNGLYAAKKNLNLYEYSKRITKDDYVFDFSYFGLYNEYIKSPAKLVYMVSSVNFYWRQILNSDPKKILLYINSKQIDPVFEEIVNDVLKNAKSNSNIYIFYSLELLDSDDISKRIDIIGENPLISDVIDLFHRKILNDFVNILIQKKNYEIQSLYYGRSSSFFLVLKKK